MERSRKCVCTTLDDILKFPPLLTGFDIFHFHPRLMVGTPYIFPPLGAVLSRKYQEPAGRTWDLDPGCINPTSDVIFAVSSL